MVCRSKQLQRVLAIAEAHRVSTDVQQDEPHVEELKRDLLEMARANDYPGFTSLGDDLFAKDSNPVNFWTRVVMSVSYAGLIAVCMKMCGCAYVYAQQYFLVNEVGVITFLAAHKHLTASDASTLLVCMV